MLTHRKRPALTIATLLIVVSIATYLALPPVVWADERLSELRVAFYSGRYAEVLTKLYDYREQPYGKKAEVDYMIASCLCRTGKRDKAKIRFEWIINRYRLEAAQRKVIEEGLLQCSASSQSRPASFREPTVTSRASERNVGVRGKGGTRIEPDPIARVAGSTVAVTSETAEVIRDIAVEEFEGRLFSLSQKGEAIQRVKELAGPNYQVEAAGPFILANNRLSSEQGLAIARALERYASFYTTQYEMPKPSKFITIYLVADVWEMQRLATRLHGIRLSESSIGYSFPLDLSMTGVIYETEFGTLAHELFHLMVRSNFGDIPPWLEEGMASLYEVSEARRSYIAGVPNWRGEILAKFWYDRPSIEPLVKMDWRSFDGTEGKQDYRRQAINHATARYLMLYLQEKNRLVHVYKAFRDQNIDDLKDSPENEAVRLLASVVQKSLSDFDKDFGSWFSRLHSNEVKLLPPEPNSQPTPTSPNSPATGTGNAPGNAPAISSPGKQRQMPLPPPPTPPKKEKP